MIKYSSGDTEQEFVPSSTPARLVPDTRAHTSIMASGKAPRDRPDIRARLTGSFTSSISGSIKEHLNRTRDASRDIGSRMPEPPPSDPRPGHGVAQGNSAAPPIGAVDRNSGLTRCGRCDLLDRLQERRETKYPPTPQTPRQRNRLMRCRESRGHVEDRQAVEVPVPLPNGFGRD